MKAVVVVAEVIRSGACLCGAVRYRVAGPLRSVIACHCETCRRGSGHYVAATAAPRQQIRISGELRWYLVDRYARRGFCPNCGAFLFWDDPRSDSLSILAGSLDQPTGVELSAHVFVAEKGDYYSIEADVPQYPGFDDSIPIEQSA